HVATAHSLEPMRPWKEEQLGGGYRLSSFCERIALESADAVVAVSPAMRDDVLASYPALDPAKVHVIRNGIDSKQYSPDLGTEAVERFGVDPERPLVVFVGRITRQKGISQLLEAALAVDPSAQILLAAGAPATAAPSGELGDPALAERFGKAGRKRAVEKFSWSAIAEETLALYPSPAA